jgi:hypothetical protein
VYTWELEVDGVQCRLVLYQGVMLKVELESDEIFHSVDGGATA